MLGKENTRKQVAGDQSRLIRMQKEDTLPSSSQQILKLPEGFIVGKAIGEGDCFFDAVAQGLRQLNPDMEFTIKSLRQVCKNLALSDHQLSDQVIKDAKDIHDSTVVLPDPSISEGELWNAYLASIEYTAEDIEGMKTQDPQLYKSLTSLKYGSTLQVPIWGRANIEGRMICSEYKVKLHIIENLPHAGCSDQLVDGLASRSIDYIDYSEENTIHIINKGGSHFEPILRKQILPHCYDTMVSQKKSGSKSVYFQQVSEKDMTDNQIDCERSSTNVEVLHAESTIVDYENRLSSEELQCRQSNESQESSTRSSSTSSDNALSDNKSPTNNVSFTGGTVEERATLFVKAFVKEFEKKIFEYSKKAEPDSKIQKTSRASAIINSVINHAIPPSPLRLIFVRGNECISYFTKEKQYKKVAKSVCRIIDTDCKDKTRKILIEASLSIFQSFEQQFIKIVDVDYSDWKRGIQKLAIDAISRVMNHLSTCSEKEDFSVDLITQGVVLGKSKSKGVFLCPGYEIKDEQSGEMLVTSELYRWTGIKKTDGKIANYYQHYLLAEYGYLEKCSYRLPFAWELEIWEKVEQEYVLSKTSEERYVHILDEEKKKELASNILKKINGNDPTKKKDIEELHEEIKNLQIHHEKEDKNTFSFNLGCLPKFFIRRKMILDELKKKLSNKNQEVEMSRMVLIHGGYGTGKSELARSYGYDKRKDSNVWANVIWIDAKTYCTLLDSFRRLAERLNIPTKNGQEINGDMEVKEQQEKGIKSIVKNVYQYFRDIKSLFIFDSANEYKEIEKFLPSHFPDLFFGKEKPYVLITSRNKDWKKEIEKIELDDGFFPEEAIAFIRKILEVKDRSQDSYLVELARALSYLPLALTQAAAYIKHEKISIIKYLELYDEAMKRSKTDYFEVPGISPELFATLEVNFDKIRSKKNIGQQSHDIVAYMAYLSPDQINIEEIFLQKKSEQDKQLALDAFDLLNKFSVIKLEESIARVHRGVQKAVRTEKEQAGTEEETLREIMKSFYLTNANHVKSVWSYASKYSKLVNEFIDSIYNGGTILHLLAKDGNEEVIKLILEKADPNKLSKIIDAVDEENFTSLDHAVMHGHLDIVKCLVGKGCSMDLQNKGDMGYIHEAANSGDLGIVKYLVEKGADVDLQDEGGMSPIHWAANSGDLDIVKYLVEKGASVNLQDSGGMNSIHWAANGGNLDIVKYLVEKGASVNLQDEDGMNSIHWAANGGNLDIVKYLVEKGSSINIKDKKGMCPLHFAAKNGCLDIVKYLVMQRIIVEPWNQVTTHLSHLTAINSYLGVVEYLTNQERIVEPQDEDGMSPLHFATIYGQLDIIEYLVSKGANVNLQNKNGISPFDYATKCHSDKNHSEIAQYFKDVCSASDLKTQSHKRHLKTFDEYTLSKKRKLENMSTTSKESALNIRLTQIKNLSDRMQGGICIEKKVNSFLENIDSHQLVKNWTNSYNKMQNNMVTMS